uniref:Uncharacterized protein n=1 Tax=Anguilla anguilla TaxID=7936 RepID=A0A0E9PZ03_ANGAN
MSQSMSPQSSVLKWFHFKPNLAH